MMAVRFVLLLLVLQFGAHCTVSTNPCGPADSACNPFATYLISASLPATEAGLNRSRVLPGSTVVLRASAGREPYSYSILLGGGNISSRGVFRAPPVIGTTSILAVDAGGRHFVGEVSTAHGAGSGTFTAVGTVSVCTQVGTIVAADFNQDGNVDVASICNVGTLRIRVSPGNGDGTFATGIDFTLSAVGNSLDVGDFNNDGVLDLAYQENNTHGIALGNGDGSFTGSWTSGVAGTPRTLVARDFNGDGNDDFAYGEGNNTEIYLGQGDGTAVKLSEVVYAAGDNQSLIAADFNGDRVQDLAIVDRAGNPSPRVFRGDGDGTFTFSAGLNEVGGSSQEVTACDINADGNGDLVVVDIGAGNLYSYLGAGDGTFTQVGSVNPAASGQSVVCQDYNSDGFMDTVSAHAGAGSFYVTLAAGDGNFQTPAIIGTATISGGDTSVAADFNNDGITDVAMPDSAGATFEVLLGN